MAYSAGPFLPAKPSLQKTFGLYEFSPETSLAEKRQVDLILALNTTTGSLYAAVGLRRLRPRCFAAAIFMAHVLGRLSVAVFGLTYNLNDLPGVEFQPRVTNWGTDQDFIPKSLPQEPFPSWNNSYTDGWSSALTQASELDDL